jgi:hypothetical protein
MWKWFDVPSEGMPRLGWQDQAGCFNSGHPAIPVWWSAIADYPPVLHTLLLATYLLL